MSGSSPKFTIPSELRLSKQWDTAIENFLTNATVGGGTAGLASLVLFRTRNNRVAFTLFGVGVGVGIAYKTASYEFEKEKKESA